jgi:hypothetical protein
MKKFLMSLIASWFDRLIFLIIFVAVSGFAVIVATMAPHNRSALGLDIAGAIGFLLPAVILGAAWGWVSLSRTQWAWATAVFLVGTFALTYKGGPLNDAYKKSDAEAVAKIETPVRAPGPPYAAHYENAKP